MEYMNLFTLQKRLLLYPYFLALLMLLGGCTLSRGYEALLVLADIAAGDGKSRLKSKTPDPRRTAVTFAAGGRTYGGDLYRSVDAPLAGILLLPGAAKEGKDDPRLKAFAITLARARFAVLVPDLEGFRSLRVGSGDIVGTVDAFAWLASRSDLSPHGRAGICAFSYAAGPAILAALDSRINDRVRFILAVGGYYDLASTLTFFTTGYFREGREWRHREPNHYGKWVFVLSNVDLLSNPTDRELFRIAAERKMADIKAPIDDLAARLSPEGQSLFMFIENQDPLKVPLLMGRLPEAIRREIAALTLADKELSLIRARILLIHGLDDDIISYTESVVLAHALPTETTRLYLLRGLMHVELKPGLIDGFKMWRAVSALLREQEADSSDKGKK